MRVIKGCPLCHGDVSGTKQVGFYCKNCNMIFSSRAVSFRHVREETKLLIEKHFMVEQAVNVPESRESGTWRIGPEEKEKLRDKAGLRRASGEEIERKSESWKLLTSATDKKKKTKNKVKKTAVKKPTKKKVTKKNPTKKKTIKKKSTKKRAVKKSKTRKKISKKKVTKKKVAKKKPTKKKVAKKSAKNRRQTKKRL